MFEKHLWEVDHPYYCHETNYCAEHGTSYQEYATWTEFINDMGDADMDMNLVFRWDWQIEEDNKNPDPYYRDEDLQIFYMGQRKGFFWSVNVKVCRADEPAVIEFLTKCWNKMKDLWQPFE